MESQREEHDENRLPSLLCERRATVDCRVTPKLGGHSLCSKTLRHWCSFFWEFCIFQARAWYTPRSSTGFAKTKDQNTYFKRWTRAGQGGTLQCSNWESEVGCAQWAQVEYVVRVSIRNTIKGLKCTVRRKRLSDMRPGTWHCLITPHPSPDIYVIPFMWQKHCCDYSGERPVCGQVWSRNRRPHLYSLWEFLVLFSHHFHSDGIYHYLLSLGFYWIHTPLLLSLLFYSFLPPPASSIPSLSSFLLSVYLPTRPFTIYGSNSIHPHIYPSILSPILPTVYLSLLSLIQTTEFYVLI